MEFTELHNQDRVEFPGQKGGELRRCSEGGAETEEGEEIDQRS